MRNEMINGRPVPYDLPVDELEALLISGDMSDFAVACEALSNRSDERAYQLLKKYITDKDKYKRLCVLKTIFRHPMAAQIKSFLEDSILSDDFLFVHNALGVVGQYEIEVSEKAVLSAVLKHLSDLHCTDLYALKILSTSDENFLNLIRIFKRSKACGQKEVIGEILLEIYSHSHAEELYALFSRDNFLKIRLLADKIFGKISMDET